MTHHTADQLSALDVALRLKHQKPLASLSADAISAQTLQTVFDAQAHELQEVEILNAKLKLALQRVTAAAIASLFQTHSESVSRTFSKDQLQEVVRISDPLMKQGLQLEEIYQASWTLLDEQKTVSSTLH